MKSSKAVLLFLSITMSLLLSSNATGVGGCNEGSNSGSIGPWKLIDGKFSDISVGMEGRVWAVNSDMNIYTRNGINGPWTRIAGGLKQLSVGVDGRVWGVTGCDYPCVCDKVCTIAGPDDLPQTIDGQPLKHISVGTDGRVWGINGDG